MAPRIDADIPALEALRRLERADGDPIRAGTTHSMWRLSTGLRIDTVTDDPSGLAASELLRVRIRGLARANDGAANAIRLFRTGEAALSEAGAHLVRIRESAIRARDAGPAASDPLAAERIAAEQGSVDEALAAIDRIASTTRFAARSLFDGASGFDIVRRPPEIADLSPISVRFDPARPTTAFLLEVTRGALRARLPAVGGEGLAASGGPVVLRVTGPLGSAVIALPDGADIDRLAAELDPSRGDTGVLVDTVAGTIESVDFGEDVRIRLEKVAGAGAFLGAGVTLIADGDSALATGQDAGASLDGVVFRANGNHLSVVSAEFTGSIDLREGTGAGTYRFEIARSGLVFPSSSAATANSPRGIGLPSLSPDDLGRPEIRSAGRRQYGSLASLRSGGKNDLLADPSNALRIVEVAIDRVSGVRSFLGAFADDELEPARRELAIHWENLKASESAIRGVDGAEGASELARTQSLFRAGVSGMAGANPIPPSVLELLE